MREKERESSERNHEPQWQTVRRRNPATKTTHQATRTCFVNHLPLHLSSHEIAKIFKTHGPIEFIYIPTIRGDRNHKCAFVQFKFPQSLPTAVRDEHRRRVENHRITTYPAKYDKPPSHVNNLINHNLPPPLQKQQSNHLKTLPKIVKMPWSTLDPIGMPLFTQNNPPSQPAKHNQPPVKLTHATLCNTLFLSTFHCMGKKHPSQNHL